MTHPDPRVVAARGAQEKGVCRPFEPCIRVSPLKATEERIAAPWDLYSAGEKSLSPPPIEQGLEAAASTCTEPRCTTSVTTGGELLSALTEVYPDDAQLVDAGVLR